MSESPRLDWLAPSSRLYFLRPCQEAIELHSANSLIFHSRRLFGACSPKADAIMALTPFLKSRPEFIAQLSSNRTDSNAAEIIPGVGFCNSLIATLARSLKRYGFSSKSARSTSASFRASRSTKSSCRRIITIISLLSRAYASAQMQHNEMGTLRPFGHQSGIRLRHQSVPRPATSALC